MASELYCESSLSIRHPGSEPPDPTKTRHSKPRGVHAIIADVRSEKTPALPLHGGGGIAEHLGAGRRWIASSVASQDQIYHVSGPRPLMNNPLVPMHMMRGGTGDSSVGRESSMPGAWSADQASSIIGPTGSRPRFQDSSHRDAYNRLTRKYPPLRDLVVLESM